MKNTLLFLLFIGFGSAFSQSIRIGLIADCQYCECEYSERWNNDYQQGLPRLIEAVDTFNNQNVDLAFHLGDFIDRDFKSFNEVSPIFEKLTMAHYHVLGNHDFSVADSLRTSVPKVLGLNKHPYYSIKKDNWVFIVLDGTDISLYRSNDSSYLIMSELTRQHYEELNRAQAKPWNGAVSSEQINWLETQLQKADKRGKNVIIFCHFPILPEGDANLWNDVELVSILEKHSSVKAFINGHHHPGNYVVINGIHYLTLQAMVRSKDKNAFAIITVKNNQIEVNGFGREPNRILKY